MYLDKRFFLGLMSSSMALMAQTQHKTDSLNNRLIDEVVLTATRSQRTASSLPLPVMVISGQSIQKGGFSRLNEVVAEQSGLVLVPTFGGAEGLQVQGLDGAYTLVLIDGQPLLGRSSGQLDLSRIAVGNIQRVEIIKGASSCLYGSEALAGVLNIITKNPTKKELTGQANYKYGRFATHDANAQVAFGHDDFSWQFFANTFATGGYKLNPNSRLPTVAPYLNHTFQPKMTYDFNPNLKLQINARFFQQYQEHQAFIQEQMHEGLASIKDMNVQTSVTQKWRGHELDYQFYFSSYGHQQKLNKPDGRLFEANFYQQYLYRPELKAKFKLNQFRDELSLGLGLNEEQLSRSFFDAKQSLSSQYFFGQYDFRAIQKLNILVGFRMDIHQQFQSQLSPKLSIGYQLWDKLSLKTSLGYGYKAPDFRQLYFDFTNASVGYTVLGRYVAEQKLQEMQARNEISSIKSSIDLSQQLKPESAINANFGLQFRSSKLNLEANAFYNNIYNLIETQALASKTNGQNVFSYLNLNKIFTYGLELNGQWQICPQLKVGMGYQYLEAKDQQKLEALAQGQVFAQNPENKEVFRLQKKHYVGLYNRSKHQANFKIDAQLPYLDTWLNFRWLYRSRFGLADSNGNSLLDEFDDFLPAYHLFHLTLSQDFSKNYQLQIGCHNLLDFKQHQALNLPGRECFARVSYAF